MLSPPLASAHVLIIIIVLIVSPLHVLSSSSLHAVRHISGSRPRTVARSKPFCSYPFLHGCQAHWSGGPHFVCYASPATSAVNVSGCLMWLRDCGTGCLKTTECSRMEGISLQILKGIIFCLVFFFFKEIVVVSHSSFYDTVHKHSFSAVFPPQLNSHIFRLRKARIAHVKNHPTTPPPQWPTESF